MLSTMGQRWRSLAAMAAGILVASVLMALVAVVKAPDARADAPNYLQLISLRAIDLNDPSVFWSIPYPLVDAPPDEIELWVYNGDVDKNLTADRRLVLDLADLKTRPPTLNKFPRLCYVTSLRA